MEYQEPDRSGRPHACTAEAEACANTPAGVLADATAVASMDAGRGWAVAFCGLGLNLALGVLYAWSVFAKALTEPVGGRAGPQQDRGQPAVHAGHRPVRAGDGSGGADAGPLRAARGGHGRGAAHGGRAHGGRAGAAGGFLAALARLRAHGRVWFRPGLCGGHASGHQMVSAGEKGAHHRTGGQGFGLAPVYIAPLAGTCWKATGLAAPS